MVAAGTRLTTLHFLPSVSDTQDDSFTFDSATFGVDADSGTYVTCGVDFIAPASGTVKIDFGGSLDHTGAAASVEVSPVVRTGAVVGSGSTILAASSDRCIRNEGTSDRRYDSHVFVEGLTAGSAYNVRLEHRTSGADATVKRRIVTVTPCN
jgi:hypothetical protein